MQPSPAEERNQKENRTNEEIDKLQRDYLGNRELILVSIPTSRNRLRWVEQRPAVELNPINQA
jgi:hypothetical protein